MFLKCKFYRQNGKLNSELVAAHISFREGSDYVAESQKTFVDGLGLLEGKPLCVSLINLLGAGQVD